jgi:Universal stress protein family
MENTKRLLVALDDSAASERAVTYVAQMLEGQKAFQILLLHVPAPIPPDSSNSAWQKTPAGAQGRSKAHGSTSAMGRGC